MKKTLLLVVGLACTIVACNKDKDNNSGNGGGNGGGNASLVGNWHVDKEVSWETEDGVTETYIYTRDSMDACEKDDHVSFRADGTGTFNKGTLQCQFDSSGNQNFTYSLSNDKKYLYISEGTDRDTNQIKDITATSFILHDSETDEDGDTYRWEVTFKKLP